jgi:hypothetical protein
VSLHEELLATSSDAECRTFERALRALARAKSRSGRICAGQLGAPAAFVLFNPDKVSVSQSEGSPNERFAP